MSSQKVLKNESIIDAKDVKSVVSLVAKNWYWFVLFIGLGIGASIFLLYTPEF